MAAIVTGLIPILRTAVDATTSYKGRTMWFGFLCIRLVTLFVSEMPWFKLDSDFSCNITTENMCTRACFNQHFDKPVIMAWNFIFVLLVLSVLLMELFTSYVRSVFQKRSSRENKREEMECMGALKNASDPGNSPTGMMTLDLHRNRNAVFFYLFSVMLRISVEVWFVYILFNWNLLKTNGNSISCTNIHGCPNQTCLVRFVAEKRMSIYAQLSISFLVIISSVVFCAYFIGHYLCNCCTKEPQNV